MSGGVPCDETPDSGMLQPVRKALAEDTGGRFAGDEAAAFACDHQDNAGVSALLCLQKRVERATGLVLGVAVEIEGRGDLDLAAADALFGTSIGRRRRFRRRLIGVGAGRMSVRPRRAFLRVRGG